MKYLDELKKEFIKEEVINGKRFKFSIYDFNHVKNIYDSAGVLADTLISVNDIKLNNFEEIRKDIENGMDEFQARKKEILTWDNSLVKLLVTAVFSAKDNADKNTHINFDKYPFLRLYWKFIKMFGKDEIDSWGSIEWDWAIYNYEKDLKEEHNKEEYEFERLKPWRNLELFKAEMEQKKNDEVLETENIKLTKKYLKENFNIDSDVEIIEEEI